MNDTSAALEDVNNVLKKTFTDMCTKLLVSMLAGVIAGAIAGLIVWFVLRLFSRLVIPIPRKIIWKIVESVFGLVMGISMIMFMLGVSQEVCWSGSYGLNREQATFLNVCSTVPVLVSACVTKAR